MVISDRSGGDGILSLAKYRDCKARVLDEHTASPLALKASAIAGDFRTAGECRRVPALERTGHDPYETRRGTPQLCIPRDLGDCWDHWVIARKHPFNDRIAAGVQLSGEAWALRDLSPRRTNREPAWSRSTDFIHPFTEFVNVKTAVTADRSMRGEPTIVGPSSNGCDTHTNDCCSFTGGQGTSAGFNSAHSGRSPMFTWWHFLLLPHVRFVLPGASSVINPMQESGFSVLEKRCERKHMPHSGGIRTLTVH